MEKMLGVTRALVDFLGDEVSQLSPGRPRVRGRAKVDRGSGRGGGGGPTGELRAVEPRRAGVSQLCQIRE